MFESFILRLRFKLELICHLSIQGGDIEFRTTFVSLKRIRCVISRIKVPKLLATAEFVKWKKKKRSESLGLLSQASCIWETLQQTEVFYIFLDVIFPVLLGPEAGAPPQLLHERMGVLVFIKSFSLVGGTNSSESYLSIRSPLIWLGLRNFLCFWFRFGVLLRTEAHADWGCLRIYLVYSTSFREIYLGWGLMILSTTFTEKGVVLKNFSQSCRI